jgi:hypothetical protein
MEIGTRIRTERGILGIETEIGTGRGIGIVTRTGTGTGRGGGEAGLLKDAGARLPRGGETTERELLPRRTARKAKRTMTGR